MKVCSQCFNDLELKQFIQANSEEKGTCDYCNSTDVDVVDESEIADFFSQFLGIFALNDSGVSLSTLIQSDWNLFANEAICIDIVNCFIKPFSPILIDSNQKVSYIDDITVCVEYWETIKDEIKWKKRFFSNISTLEELGWQSIFDEKQTFEWPNNEYLFRGRLHYNSNQKEYKLEDMGCPHNGQVPAGRANPQGIPYLYLSKSIETVLYEIRSTFLDEISVGTFKIKSDATIILVDFTEKASAFSKIDEIVEYTKSMLLKRYISTDLSKPIRRYDSEIEYIPTQFICEYIRLISNADGILFNSSLHKGGKNIVLFEQDKVECVSVELQRVSHIEIVANPI
jgi:hypothetical protein